MSHRFVTKYVDHVDRCLQVRRVVFSFVEGFGKQGEHLPCSPQFCRGYCKKNR